VDREAETCPPGSSLVLATRWSLLPELNTGPRCGRRCDRPTDGKRDIGRGGDAPG
jgi:hypothetical protein